MNYLDIIILVPLAYFAYKGFAKGFVITLAMFAGLLIGLYAAIHFSEYSAEVLTRNFELRSDNIHLISYLFTFLVVLVMVYLLGQFLTGVLKTTGLGIINRIAGLLLGLVKGILIISVLLVILGKIDPRSFLIPEATKNESVLFKPVSGISEKVYPVLNSSTKKAKDLIFENDESRPGSKSRN